MLSALTAAAQRNPCDGAAGRGTIPGNEDSSARTAAARTSTNASPIPFVVAALIGDCRMPEVRLVAGTQRDPRGALPFHLKLPKSRCRQSWSILRQSSALRILGWMKARTLPGGSTAEQAAVNR